MGLIVTDINISKKNSTEWILASPVSSIIVNDKLYDFFKLLQNSDSYSSAHESFNEYFNSTLSLDEFNNLIKKHFGGRGFLVYDDISQRKKSYLSLKIDLISKDKGIAISKYLDFLFNEKIFTPLVCVAILTIFTTIYAYHVYSDRYHLIDLFYGFIIVNISLFIHEFGHITAYNYFIKKNNIIHHNTSGQIGFGLYFIFPVYYSNITQAWSLDKKSRVIINFAGIYFQLLFSFILLIVGLFLQKLWLILPAYSIIIYSLFNLNPFIRNDGYWILSDLTNTHNLYEKSKLELKLFLSKFKLSKINWKIIYSLGNYLLFIILTINLILKAKGDLLYFPINLFRSTYNAMILDFNNVKFEVAWIYYLAFYIIIIKFFINTRLFIIKKTV